MADRVKKLDLKGLKCPMPVLLTRKALVRLAAGERLVVACTDPLSGIDIPHLARETGDLVESAETRDGVFIFRLLRLG